MEDDLYRAPSASLDRQGSGGSDLNLVSQAGALLMKTKGWMTLFKVLFFFFFVVIEIVACGALIGGLATDQRMWPIGFVVGATFFYALMGLLYFWIGWTIHRVTRAIGALGLALNGDSLLDVLKMNQRMWKSWGMITVVALVAYPVLIVVFFVFAAASAAG